MDAIKAIGLTKKFEDTLAVDRLDLTVFEGEVFSLLGINGAGKTTTVRMLSCLLEPTEGDALLLGHSIRTERTAVKSLIAISPQESAVAMGLTVKENLKLMCGVYGLSRDESEARIAYLAERLSLSSVLSRRAARLSGGYQRRLSIAMALVGSPRILFLDEPTLGLDVIARSELWELIRALKGSVTVLLTTHYMEEAEALSDRIAIMRDGHLLTVGTAEELKRQAGVDRFEDAFVRIVRGEGREQ